MKKIMFNDKYGLTEAVLDGRKTMTRRVEKDIEFDTYLNIEGTNVERIIFDNNYYFNIYKGSILLASHKVRYNIGEVVAIAQSYENIMKGNSKAELENYIDHLNEDVWNGLYHEKNGDENELDAGWKNKMYVKADLMPHQIKITNIKIERLQDINDEDCLREGIREGDFMNTWDKYYYTIGSENHKTFKTPREAFASLIDKVSGGCTWESNPYVFCYEFELIK